MEIIILGAGTAIPFAGYSPASILLRVEAGDALIDLGPGAIQRASLFGLEYLKLETVFLTHLHSDHSLDLVTFLQANDSTPNIIRSTPLQIFGCVGTKDWYDKLMGAYPGISPSAYPLVITENGENSWSWRGYRISSLLTGHTESSLAYRFEGKESSFVYTGDAVYSDSLVNFCANVDLLISECSFPAAWNTTDHLTSDGVGNLAEKASVKHLVITHQYPPALVEDITSQIAVSYSGKITIASDGYSFIIPEEILVK